jgi:type IV secretion system protein VirD4
MGVDEIAVMDGSKCILQIRGERPFFSKKYDITQHKNYRYLSDYDKRHHFDIADFLSTKLKLKPDDEYDVIEIDLTEETPSA